MGRKAPHGVFPVTNRSEGKDEGEGTPSAHGYLLTIVRGMRTASVTNEHAGLANLLRGPDSSGR
jgi:hypothetical protein